VNEAKVCSCFFNSFVVDIVIGEWLIGWKLGGCRKDGGEKKESMITFPDFRSSTSASASSTS
jgi:hypothetical protein